MIPPTSKSILVNNLAAGTHYDLCVLAIYDDQVTALTATRVIGCIHFTTEPQYLRCHFMQSQFLGGTIVVIIGGIIVASVLAFIIFLIVRYRVCNQGDADKVSLAPVLLFCSFSAHYFCSYEPWVSNRIAFILLSLCQALEMGDIRSLSSDGQLQGCGIPKSLSKQVLRPEKNDKDCLRVALPPPEPAKQRPPVVVASTKTSVPDCTVSTSAASHSWHPASPGAPRPKRSNAPPKPSAAQADVELDNMNRNNSSEVKIPNAVALAVPGQPTKWTAVPRVPRPQQASRHYMTVPAGGARVNRRHSLNADSYRERCYVAYPKPGASLRSKRSLSMSGELPQLESTTNIQRARDKLSRSEWLLESTL